MTSSLRMNMGFNKKQRHIILYREVKNEKSRAESGILWLGKF